MEVWVESVEMFTRNEAKHKHVTIKVAQTSTEREKADSVSATNKAAAQRDKLTGRVRDVCEQTTASFPASEGFSFPADFRYVRD